MIKSKSIKTILFSFSSLLIFITLFYLVVNFNKPVTIVVDGIEIETYTIRDTVIDVLSENDIVLEDGASVFPSENSKISRGERIVLKNPVPVTLHLGKMDSYDIVTTSQNVGDFLKEQGIEIDDGDIITPSIDTQIVTGLEINVKYVDTKIEYEQISIPYDTEARYNDEIFEGNQNLIQEGKDGLRVIKHEIYYENGLEVNNNIIYDNVEVQPVNKIIEIGTKKVEVVSLSSENFNDFVVNADDNVKISFLGQTYSIAYVKEVEATAFYDSGTNGNHITATGNRTVYNPEGWSTLAVDPKVIPLGTRMYVEGYGFGIAHDTGGAIKGNIIDVFMPSRESAYKWGRKKGIKIYVLE